MSRMLGEVRRCLRGLARSPGFTATAVLSLGLAVGAVAAIFAVVDAVLLKPLPFPGAERIVRALRVQPPCNDCPISRPALLEWQAEGGAVFEAVGAFTGATVNLTGDGDAERLAANRVTPELWQVLGVNAMLGRTFGTEDERASRDVVVVSHGFWQRRLDAAPNVVGRTLVLNGTPHEVVGVMPAHFNYPDGELWLPTHLPGATTPRGNNYLAVVARLRERISLAPAGDALRAITARQAQAFPEEHAGLTAKLVPLQERVTGPVAPTLKVLLAAAAMVVLIACANLASLMLARAQSRRREVALRAALGGSRRRLVSTLLTEAVAIAVLGAGLGGAIAAAAVALLPALAPDLLPAYNPVVIDGGVVAFVVAVALAALCGFGLLPAWHAAGADPAGALHDEARGGLGGRARSGARAALVVAEVALALMLLAGSALLIESLRRLGQVDPGVEIDRVLTANLSLPDTPNRAGESIWEWYTRHTGAAAPRIDTLLERLRRMPEFEHVALVDAVPLSGRSNTNSTVTVVGQEPRAEGRTPMTEWRFVSADYFRTLGLSVVRGRAFDDSDGRASGEQTEVLVNQAFVQAFLPDVDPLGRQVNVMDDVPKTIVGVVQSARQWGLDREPSPEVYFPIFDSFISDLSLVARTRAEPEGATEALRRAVAEVAPEVPVSDVRPMTVLVRDAARMRRFLALLMGAFTAVALTLAVVGLYGVIAYSVAQRRAEIGVRMSLGADSGRVLGMVLRQGLALLLGGIGIGLVGALALSRVIAGQLFEVAPYDPLVLGAVVLVLLAVGLAAAWLPARRAAGTSPIEALRCE